MSRPFAKSIARPTFAEFNEPLDASQYITNKKLKYSFCQPNLCHPNKNIGSQSNYQNLIKANTLAFYPCVNTIDKTQLYINLITKVNLNDNVPVISNLAGNFPIAISPTPISNVIYNIDASGVLFGNTICGITNYNNFIEYASPYSTSNPGNISNL